MSSTLKKKLINGSLGSFSIRSANVALSFLISVLLAKQLGADQFGVFTYVTTIITLLSVPIAVGLPELLSRNISIYNSQQKWPLMKGLLQWSTLRVLYFSAIIITTCIAIVLIFSDSLPGQSVHVFLLALPLLPLVAFNNLRAATLRGLHRFTLAQTPENLIQPLFFIIAFGIIVWLYNDTTSETAMLTRIAAVACGFIFGMAALLRVKPKDITTAIAAKDKNAWRKSSNSFLLLGAMLTINTQIDTLLVGMYLPASDIGIYRVISIGAMLVAFFYSAVNPVLGPLIADLHANKNSGKLSRMLTRSSWAVFLCSLPVALLFIFFSAEILRFIYGEEYVAGALALSILASSQLIITMLGPGSVVLNMTGNEKYNSRLCVAATAANAILNLIFIPQWGINGAAIATGISLAGWRIAAALITHIKLNMNTTIFCRIQRA